MGAVTILYLMVLHLALLAAVLKGSRMVKLWHRFGFDHPYYISRIARAHYVLRRVDATVPPSAVVILGDSILAHIAPTAIAPFGVNFSVPGQRADHLLSQLPKYHCLQRASLVVLMIGTNDIITRRAEGLEDRLQAILAEIPPGVPVVMASIPPLRDFPDETLAAARVVQAICEQNQRCRFVDAHAALGGMLHPDGIHLSDDGYRVLVPLLREAVLNVSSRC